jgi:hypothetical protein
MANRYLYQGVKAGFTRNVGTVLDTTTAGTFNSTYTDGGISISSASTSKVICDFTDGSGAADHATTGETLQVRWDTNTSGAGSGAVLMQLSNNSDQPVLRALQQTTSTLRLQYNSGTLASPVWTQIGFDITIPAGLVTWNLILTIDAAGTAHTYQMLLNNVYQFSGTFSMSLLTRVDNVNFVGNTSVTFIVSQVMATIGIGLVGSFVGCLKASGVGSNAGMIGAYTDVNEAILSDATLVSSGTAAQKTTFAMADLPAISGLTVGAESRHTFRAKNDGSAPANLKSVIRQSGSDTSSSAVSGMGAGFAPFTVSYNLTYAQINTAGFELGWESAT